MTNFVKKALKTFAASAIVVGLCFVVYFLALQKYKPSFQKSPREGNQVEFLFSVDSAKVYRFIDPGTKRFKYLVTSPCGKNTIIE